MERVAVVTGASSGIGRAASEILADRGFVVALSARRRHLLEELGVKIEARGGRASVHPADLSEERGTKSLFESVMDTHGRIDVLVNSAGFAKCGPVEYLTRSDVRGEFEVNVFAPYQLAALVSPVMRAQGGGRIIHISSINCKLAFPIGSMYSPAKSALELFTDSLRLELAPWGIRVIVVVPGATDTPAYDLSIQSARLYLTRTDNPYQHNIERAEQLLRQHRRAVVPPSRIAKTILRAATAKRPRLRYVVTLRAWWKYYLKPFVPQRLLDRIIINAFRPRPMVRT